MKVQRLSYCLAPIFGRGYLQPILQLLGGMWKCKIWVSVAAICIPKLLVDKQVNAIGAGIHHKSSENFSTYQPMGIGRHTYWRYWARCCPPTHVSKARCDDGSWEPSWRLDDRKRPKLSAILQHRVMLEDVLAQSLACAHARKGLQTNILKASPHSFWDTSRLELMIQTSAGTFWCDWTKL